MQERWQKYKWIPMTVAGSAIFAAGFAFFLPKEFLYGSV